MTAAEMLLIIIFKLCQTVLNCVKLIPLSFSICMSSRVIHVTYSCWHVAAAGHVIRPHTYYLLVRLLYRIYTLVSYFIRALVSH